MDNHFENKGGEQNIAQGENPIGKQVNNYGVPPELFAKYVEELGVTKSALTSFFKILEQEQVPSWELDSKLREIAERYRDLLQRFQTISSDDPEVRSLKKQAKDAIEAGRFAEAEDLLAHARERDRAAVARLKESLAEQQAALEKRQLSEAASCVEQADLQRLQYRYEKSAQYYQEAAVTLPEGLKRERADCLGAAGYDLERIARYTEALHLFETSLSISREIGDIKEIGRSLNNIGSVYQIQGKSEEALSYFEQSLFICQEIDDTEGKGRAINNLAAIYWSKGDYPKALKYLEESLILRQDINDKKGEGGTLNNIGQIYYAQGDHTTALRYYEQALVITRKTGDKNGESACINNISQIYHLQGNYDVALEYLEQSLVISQQISDRKGEGVILNNIAMIYEVKGDYPTALKQYEQALQIAEEIGAKADETGSSWNIGCLYIKQRELAKAEPYLSRAVELKEQLEAPNLEDYREVLEAVRAELRAQGE